MVWVCGSQRQIVSVDPKQLIIKRIILTGAQLAPSIELGDSAMAAGYPFRTQKNKAVVRTQELLDIESCSQDRSPRMMVILCHCM